MQATLPLPPSLPPSLQVRSDAVEALSPPSKDMQATLPLPPSLPPPPPGAQ